jgi:hypothetical protein
MWIEYLDNSQPIRAIFGEELPSLNSFALKEVLYDVQKKSLKLIGDLSLYPDTPPPKWVKGKFNCVQITLELWNVKFFKIGELGALDLIDLNIDKCGDSITCNTNSGLYCEAEIFDLLNIGAYQDGERL